MKDALYYEAHITIDPVLDEEKLDELKAIAEFSRFRVAELMLQKRKEDTPERSKYDTFMTGRDRYPEELVKRTENCMADLRAAGYAVRRMKIEAALFDQRYDWNGDPTHAA